MVIVEKNQSIMLLDAFSVNRNPRILVQSQRHFRNHVANCCLYEFEDLIGNIDCVDLFAPTNSYEFTEFVFKWTKRITRSKQFANWIRPEPNRHMLDQDYDLFFMIMPNLLDIYAIDSIKNRRQRCKKSVCYLIEVWQHDLSRSKLLLKFLTSFDHIFVGVQHAVEPLSQLTGRPCTYLPPGVDAVRFCPYPAMPERYIDVCNLGRRSPITHQALLKAAEVGRLHYFYDTVQGDSFYIRDHREHRMLIANLLKRSRFTITNRANANEPHKTAGHQEIGYRFMEGVASGAILIGTPPKTSTFATYFDWQDAVIELPFDAPNIAEFIAALDAQPERLSQARKNNVVNALLRHDWSQRWRTILETVGMAPTADLLTREAHLKQLAQSYESLVARPDASVPSNLAQLSIDFPLLRSSSSETLVPLNAALE